MDDQRLFTIGEGQPLADDLVALAAAEPRTGRIGVAYDGGAAARQALRLGTELAQRVDSSLLILGSLEADIEG
ncbi:MAG: hypothetical protein ACOYD4_17915, partial [Solirubrobacterales bacterium]